MKTVYLHIGAAKTATTAIQHFCRMHHGALAERGIWFPTHLSTHHDIVDDILHGPRTTPHLFDSVLTEFASSRFSCLLLSAETFFLRAARINAQHIPALLASFRLVVVCYVRRTDEFMHSLYQTNVRGRARCTRTVLEFVEAQPPRYALRLTCIDDLFQPDEFIIKSYDTVKAYILEDFFSTLPGGAGPELRDAFPTKHINARLSARQILFLRRLNERRVDQPVFVQVRRALQALSDGDRSPLIPLAERRELVRLYNSELDALNRRFGCSLAPVPVPCDDQEAVSALSPEDVASILEGLRERLDPSAMSHLETDLAAL